MKNKRAIALMWSFALTPLALVLLSMPSLPHQIPLHWSLGGAVRYGSPWELLLMAGLSPVIALLYQFFPRLDPRKKNYDRFQTQYDAFGLPIPLFFLAIICIILSESFWPGRITIYKAVGLLIGLLFMVIGNLMGKVKSNFFVGFRTPWTLSDPDVWNRTQRLGGQVFFLLGLLSSIACFFLSETLYFFVFFLGLLGGIAFIALMSWRWYRRTQRQP